MRVTVVGVVVFAGLVAAGGEEAAGPAFFAVFTLGGMADFGGSTVRRAGRYLATGAVAAAMLLLAAALEDWPALVVAATGAITFATIFLGTLGGPFYGARFPIVIGFLYGATTVVTGDALVERIVGWTIGTVAITLGALLLWPGHDRTEVPARLADLLRRVAAATGGAPSPAVRAQLLDASHRLRIAANAAHLHTGAVAGDERHRAEVVHAGERLAAATATIAAPVPGPDDRTLLRVAAETTRRCAEAIAHADSDPVRGAAAALEAALDHHATAMAATLDPTTAAQVSATATDARIRSRIALEVAQLVDNEATTEPGTVGDAVDDRPEIALRAQLTLRSLWLRNALRAAAALSIAMALILAGVGDDHGFWVALGAFTVLRADLATIGRSAGWTILGTLIGFVVSSGVVLLSESAHWVLWVAFVVALFVAGLGDRLRPEVGAAAFTTLLVSIYTIVEPAGLRTGEARLANVTIGACITIGVTLVLWPRPGRAPRRLVADVVERTRGELTAGLAGSPPPEPLAVVGDLDRVLDVVSTSAPRALPDELRARVLVTVDLSAALVDRVGDLGPALRDALDTDGARVDGALGGFAARLAREPAPDPSPPPTALVGVLTDALADGAMEPSTVSAGLRTAASLALVHRVAVGQPPTVTGTLE